MFPNEAQTRKQLIDAQIKKAGWNIFDRNEVKFEVPASGDDENWTDGITDYTFYLPNGEIIAIIEAKRQSRSPHTARETVPLLVTIFNTRLNTARLVRLVPTMLLPI